MNICSIILVLILSFFSEPASFSAEGKATYYADRMQGHRTANGERYDRGQYTAAHATLPFNTMLQVTNVKNGKSVVVRINDRKARSRQFIIDLSKAAAAELDIVRAGVGHVRLKEVKAEEEQQPTVPLAVSNSDRNGKR